MKTVPKRLHTTVYGKSKLGMCPYSVNLQLFCNCKTTLCGPSQEKNIQCTSALIPFKAVHNYLKSSFTYSRYIFPNNAHLLADLCILF